MNLGKENKWINGQKILIGNLTFSDKMKSDRFEYGTFNSEAWAVISGSQKISNAQENFW